jgi:hypothetical protein
MPSACYLRAGVGSTGTARGMVPEGSLDSIQSDALWWQERVGERPARHAAGGARQAHGPRGTVRSATEHSHGGPRSAACLHAVVVRRECDQNKLSGTIGSWIGSMAKLTYL